MITLILGSLGLSVLLAMMIHSVLDASLSEGERSLAMAGTVLLAGCIIILAHSAVLLYLT